MRVGGAAELLLEPADPTELAAAVGAAREAGCEPRLLGGGANLLVADGVLPGVVIATDRLRRAFRFVPAEYRAELHGVADDDPFVEVAPRVHFPEREEAPRLVAWAGATMLSLVNQAKRLGWSGLEGLAGVPGHVGGGVAMNAGGSWGDLWDVIERVRVVEPDGTERDLLRADCAPSYRNGNLRGRVVSGVVLALRPDSKAAVEQRVADYLREKRATQPVTESSSGCIFKNPDPELSDGLGAGALIDRCGLKGTGVGPAEVSERHGNFVVNRGGASASQVFELIRRVRAEVAERTGVVLEREVQVWAAERDPTV